MTFESNDENSGLICANNVNSIHITNRLYFDGKMADGELFQTSTGTQNLITLTIEPHSDKFGNSSINERSVLNGRSIVFEHRRRRRITERNYIPTFYSVYNTF